MFGCEKSVNICNQTQQRDDKSYKKEEKKMHIFNLDLNSSSLSLLQSS